MEDKFLTVAVYLSENDREVIREFAAQNGLSFSAATRWIVREWARHCAPRVFTTKQPADQPEK